MSLLSVDDLSIHYDGVAAVDELSFSVDACESVGLVGASGSGKSQTALALLGLTPANAAVSGSIRFDGAEIVGAPGQQLDALRATRIAMVFQDPAQSLNPYLRIGDQLAPILVVHGIASRGEALERVLAGLETVGLPDPERQVRAYPHELSGGMRQRVMIAAALLAEPDLLVADEPTTALDVTVQAQILELLDAVRGRTALLLITHDLGVVAGQCERTLVLDHGRLVESGTTRQVFGAPAHAHTQKLLEAAPRIDRGRVPDPVDAKPLVEVERLSVVYGARRKRQVAVKSVDLDIKSGETFAIVGESGSGKSSLVRALLGLVPADSGTISFLGKTLAADLRRRDKNECRDLQMVFQDPVSSLDPQMRIASIVVEPLSVHEPGLDRAGRRARAARVLEQVGLPAEFAERYPHELSGGQAQRVAIARALVLEPRLLVCDEAVAALDGAVRAQVLDLLREVQARTGLSIVFISHDLGVVRTFSHRVAVMYLGRVVELADNRSLFGAPRHPYTQALVAAVPVPDPDAERRGKPLKGEVPSMLSPPAGCAFHPRCALATAACSQSIPELRDIETSRVACILA